MADHKELRKQTLSAIESLQDAIDHLQGCIDHDIDGMVMSPILHMEVDSMRDWYRRLSRVRHDINDFYRRLDT